MIDIAKQIAYWRTSVEEDWVVAKKLVADESVRHGLFFAHLALEKMLKRTSVAQRTRLRRGYTALRIWQKSPNCRWEPTTPKFWVK